MKNYVVQTLCRVTGTRHSGDNVPMAAEDKFPIYQQVQKQSYRSIRHFLQGDWEYVLLQDDCEHMFDVFRQNFTKIYQLWTEQECNILFCGLDVQFVQPTTLFGEFDKFLMFNYTDPKQSNTLEHNYNCDIRYYPSTMDPKEMEWTQTEMHNLKIWADEQDIHNHIMWRQEGVTPENSCRPHLAYQGMGIGDLSNQAVIEAHNQWNGIHINQAQIIHWHTSRGPENRLALMTGINNSLNVPEV